MLSNGTTFAAIGAAVGEIYWNNQFLAFVFYYIRLDVIPMLYTVTLLLDSLVNVG